MVQGDMNKIVGMLKGNWRYMFESNNQIDVWWTYLKDYESEDVRQGVVRYILNYQKEPTISDILESIKKVRANRTRQTSIGGTIRCISCRDTGLVVTESPTGIMQGRPCTSCEMGKIRYPWEFLTEEQKEELKNKFPTPMEADEAFVRSYVYGEKDEKTRKEQGA